MGETRGEKQNAFYASKLPGKNINQELDDLYQVALLAFPDTTKQEFDGLLRTQVMTSVSLTTRKTLIRQDEKRERLAKAGIRPR